MPDLFSALQQSFEAMGWQWRPIEGREVIEADFEAYHTRVSLHVQVFPEINALSVVSERALAEGGRETLWAIAELLMRANTHLTLGAFEMDWDARRVLFRVSNVFTETGADEKIIASLVQAAVLETDRIAPMLAIVEGTPENKLPGVDLAALLAREDLLPAVDSMEGES